MCLPTVSATGLSSRLTPLYAGGVDRLSPALLWSCLLALAPCACASGGAARERVAPPEKPFSDYRPKLSPDTILDYRPRLAGTVDGLPDAEPENLPALIRALGTWKARAASEPGSFREGNPALGAPRREYVPSDTELIVSLLGDRIRAVVDAGPPGEVAGVLAAAGLALSGVDYRHITVTHADVMGSGRFFYASEPEAVRVELPAGAAE